MIEMPPHLLSAQEIEARSFVASVPMFDGLDGAFVNMLAKGLEAKEFQPGEILFEKGSEGDDMFFVREGSVDVLLDLDDPPVATRGKDTFFGEARVLFFQFLRSAVASLTRKDCRWRCSTTAHEMLTYAPMPRRAFNATPSRGRAWTRSSVGSPVCQKEREKKLFVAIHVAHGSTKRWCFLQRRRRSSAARPVSGGRRWFGRLRRSWRWQRRSAGLSSQRRRRWRPTNRSGASSSYVLGPLCSRFCALLSAGSLSSPRLLC